MIKNKYLSVILFICLIIVILYVNYSSLFSEKKENFVSNWEYNDDFKHPVRPQDWSIYAKPTSPPDKKPAQTAQMPDIGTFKLFDTITSKFLNMNRTKNIGMMDSNDGIQMYLDTTSNIVGNRISGTVGIVDYMNDNYLHNGNGIISTENKISINPNITIHSKDTVYGDITINWIFCPTSSDNVYNIYNSGAWLNIMKDEKGEDIPTFSQVKRDWLVFGDVGQIFENYVKFTYKITDTISKNSMFIDPNSHKASLSDTYSSTFVVNDNLERTYFSRHKSYVLQDMYNGRCLMPNFMGILSTHVFIQENNNLGWHFYKTAKSDEFYIFNSSNNLWLNSDGNNISCKTVPSIWKISGSALKYFVVDKSPFIIQDLSTKKYITYDAPKDLLKLDTKIHYYKSRYINGKDSTGGIFLIDLNSNKYLGIEEYKVVEMNYDSNIQDQFSWSLIKSKQDQSGTKTSYNIFKMTGFTSSNDTKDALYLDYDDETETLFVGLADPEKYGENNYRKWNILVGGSGATESFVGSMYESFISLNDVKPKMDLPLPPNAMQSAGIYAANTGNQFGSMLPGVSQLPSLPPQASATIVNNAQMPDGTPMPNDPSVAAQSIISNITDNMLNPIKTKSSVSILNGQPYEYNEMTSFKDSKEAGINPKNEVSSNKDILQQYVNANISGKIVDGGGKTLAVPLGNRYFLDTHTTCMKKHGNGNISRNILVDNMKYMHYADGELDMRNTGLLNSALGSLQEINKNMIIKQSDSINNQSHPDNKCIKITIDTDGNKKYYDTKYVSVGDCRKIDKVAFVGGDKSVCEKFTPNMKEDNEYNNNLYAMIDIKDDAITRFFLTSVSVIGLYIYYCMISKK